jgi:MFS-type transporter involved in bile tolerance (Atg22 family)
MTNGIAPKRSKRVTFSWALWDWAEQPYPTLMQTFIFPVYLTGTVASGIANADIMLGWATAIAGIVLALIAPVLGRRSDQNGRRKFWLLVNTGILIVITASAFFVEPKPEYFLFGLVLYGIGSVIQESAFINYSALLKEYDRVLAQSLKVLTANGETIKSAVVSGKQDVVQQLLNYPEQIIAECEKLERQTNGK